MFKLTAWTVDAGDFRVQIGQSVGDTTNELYAFRYCQHFIFKIVGKRAVWQKFCDKPQLGNCAGVYKKTNTICSN